MCNNWYHDNIPEHLFEDEEIYDLVTSAWDAGWDACRERMRGAV